ncbi:MAG TPA: hypothetical protein VLC98_16420 [Phnomibacter sp.]|nr:hypothetical protein [Phnomibacter sp.]
MQIKVWICTALLIAAFLLARNVLARAGMLLQEKERKTANNLLLATMSMNLLLTLVYFACMVIAGIYSRQYVPILGFIIPAIYVALYVFINNRLYNRFFELGYPNQFSRMFVQSRVILLVGFLIYGACLLQWLQTFNRP